MTLREAGDARHVLMGAAVADHLLSNAQAVDVLKRHYSSLTPENVMKWGQIHPQRGNYYWAAADRLVNFAQNNGQMVHGHTLLWHTELPSWATTADVEGHIKTIVGRYKGRIRSWDVVNEVLSDDGVSLRNTMYSSVDTLVNAFKWAHEADPDAILYINDYNIEDARAKSNRMYSLVKELLAKGAPVHGVGFQCHFNTDWTPSAALAVNVKRFAALGLRIHISEFDCAKKSGATNERQAQLYKAMVEAALTAGPDLDKFTTWGFTDASTWLPGQAPLPFDTNFQPKPAVAAMIEALGGATTPEEEPNMPTPIGGTVKLYQSGPGGDVASNKIIQNALNQEFGGVTVDGDYGPQTTAAYVKWQQSIGAAAQPYDGYPGAVSLPPLGLKYSFAVDKTVPAAGDPSVEPAHNYSRTTYGGVTVNTRTKQMLQTAQKLYGKTLPMTQGSYNAGGVAASAGTHDGGGAADIGLHDSAAVIALRKAGFAAWQRTPDEGFAYHIHVEAIGDRELSSGARDQVAKYFAGRNALVSNSVDPVTHWVPQWAVKYKPSGGVALTVYNPAPTTPPVEPPPVVVPPVVVPPVEKEWVWSNVQFGQTNNSVKIVQKALNAKVPAALLVDGNFGNATKAVYQKWQQKLGFTGADADGLVGKTSLTALALAAGFDIRDGSDPTVPPTPPATSGKITPGQVLFARFTGTFNVEQVIRAACAANGFTYSTAWLNGYKTAMGRESGGDPNAANLWDSNAINPAGYSSVRDYGNRGTFGPAMNGAYAPFQCSRGAWQCIPQTFAAYHAPGTSLSIYDPVASAAASMKYVTSRYGVATNGSNLASRVQQFDPTRPPKGY